MGLIPVLLPVWSREAMRLSLLPSFFLSPVHGELKGLEGTALTGLVEGFNRSFRQRLYSSSQFGESSSLKPSSREQEKKKKKAVKASLLFKPNR